MRHASVFAAVIGCMCFMQAEFGLGQEVSAQYAFLAEQAGKRGIEAFEKERYVEAAEAFEEAYKLNKTWKLLYNIGQSNAAAKRHGQALKAFEQYLSEAGDDAPKDRADTANSEIARLKNLVGFLDVTAPDGAKIFIDNIERGVAPLPGALAVNASQKQVARAELKDGTKIEKEFEETAAYMGVPTSPRLQRDGRRPQARETGGHRHEY